MATNENFQTPARFFSSCQLERRHAMAICINCTVGINPYRGIFGFFVLRLRCSEGGWVWCGEGKTRAFRSVAHLAVHRALLMYRYLD